ncbi:MAG: hypothetical protein AAGE65_05130 [Planctomycetota bacterium]
MAEASGERTPPTLAERLEELGTDPLFGMQPVGPDRTITLRGDAVLDNVFVSPLGDAAIVIGRLNGVDLSAWAATWLPWVMGAAGVAAVMVFLACAVRCGWTRKGEERGEWYCRKCRYLRRGSLTQVRSDASDRPCPECGSTRLRPGGAWGWRASSAAAVIGTAGLSLTGAGVWAWGDPEGMAERLRSLGVRWSWTWHDEAFRRGWTGLTDHSSYRTYLFAVDLDTGRERWREPWPAGLALPDAFFWGEAEDGDRLLLASERPRSDSSSWSKVELIRLDRGRLAARSSPLLTAFGPPWSRQGRQLSLTRYPDRSDLFVTWLDAAPKPTAVVAQLGREDLELWWVDRYDLRAYVDGLGEPRETPPQVRSVAFVGGRFFVTADNGRVYPFVVQHLQRRAYVDRSPLRDRGEPPGEIKRSGHRYETTAEAEGWTTRWLPGGRAEVPTAGWYQSWHGPALDDPWGRSPGVAVYTITPAAGTWVKQRFTTPTGFKAAWVVAYGGDGNGRGRKQGLLWWPHSNGHGVLSPSGIDWLRTDGTNERIVTLGPVRGVNWFGGVRSLAVYDLADLTPTSTNDDDARQWVVRQERPQKTQRD